MLEDGQVVLELHLVTLLLLTFVLEEFESGVEDDFPLELGVALLESKVEDLVVVFEDFVQHFELQSRLELLKELGLVDRHGIILVFIVVKVSDTDSYLVRHHSILTGLVQRYEPMVQRFLLIGKLVFRLNGGEDLLEGTDHVTVEANADHLNHNLELILLGSVSLDVSVPYRGERSDDPVDRRDVKTPVVWLLNSIFRILIYPTVLVLQCLLPDQDPTAGKEMRHEEQDHQEINDVDHFGELLFFD